MLSESAAASASAVVVIPAHNEATVLGRCLSALLAGAGLDEFDVLVVSNGSVDATVEIATEVGAALGHHVDVLDLPVASKSGALRAADEFLVAAGRQHVPRLYLDADVILTSDAARRVAASVRGNEPRLALARIDVDVSASSWLVRQYYRAWLASGYIARQDAGSGVFALNAAGLERVGAFPDVINDDGYVARSFDKEERVVCDVPFRSFAARSVAALVRRRARIVNGNRELDRLKPRTSTADDENPAADLLGAVMNRRVSPISAAVFVAVTVAARALAWWRRATGSAGRWSTDASTRSESAGAAAETRQRAATRSMIGGTP